MTRISSIDIFRALTMLLMVFVNDLWTLHDTPRWLDHASAREDAMGLADIVFPAFLFIVGLSIPFAINSRIHKGESKSSILLHIIMRAWALIVMGFFFVNHEYYRQDVTFWERNAREVVLVIAFILIWNHYEKDNVFKIIPVWMLQALGIYLLAGLAFEYKGGTLSNPQWLSPHWWGILGLIGWSYLLASVLYLLAGNRIWIIAIFWIILHFLNAQEFRPIAGSYRFRLLISASNYTLVMSGLMATSIFFKMKELKKEHYFPLLILIPAVISAAYGIRTRPIWGISKIFGTPSWTAITAAISFTMFAVIFWIADIRKHTRWAIPFLPAGRNALTAYMLPGIIYALFYPQIAHLPAIYTGGMAGIGKSLLFAFLIIILTWGLEKAKIKIKL